MAVAVQFFALGMAMLFAFQLLFYIVRTVRELIG